MEKVRSSTPDLVQANIEAIAELFPNVMTESMNDEGNLVRAVDFDHLRQELSDHVVDGPQERYRLDWPGKRAAMLAANAPTRSTLRPMLEESVDFENTKNIFIEGDNLEALKILQESYLGKVKLIYIDPPYNTGNDFIYNDDFAESTAEYLERSGQTDESGTRLIANTESNGRFHSDWLNMMYPRLKLARNLLADDGVIFLSIDDDEVANLRLLGDQIFGANNFLANVVWQKKYTRANDARWFSDNHDHILCYARNSSAFSLNLLPRGEEQLKAYQNPDGHPKGPWKATPLHAKSGTNTSKYVFINGKSWEPPTGTFRRFNDETMQKMNVGDEIWFGADGNQTPSRKSFLSEVKEGVTPVTIWPYDEVGHNHEASTELKDLDLGGLFSNPKPTRLIRRILELGTDKDALVLDFFAGSATTAHAVMQANAQDGGSRRWICIQLPEPTSETSSAYIAGYPDLAQLSRERIRRAAVRLCGENQVLEAQRDTGFRAFRVDSSTYASSLMAPDNYVQDELVTHVESIKGDRSDLDLLLQIMIDWGLDLSLSVQIEHVDESVIYSVDDGALTANLGDNLSGSVIRAIAQRRPVRAVFRDTAFATDAERINVQQIFREVSPDTQVKVF
jgi:adenine-specific DNA-methyltransferase